jgi:hypothetical protein
MKNGKGGNIHINPKMFAFLPLNSHQTVSEKMSPPLEEIIFAEKLLKF